MAASRPRLGTRTPHLRVFEAQSLDSRSVVAPLPTQTLLGMLRMYDAAIADLRALRDPALAKQIARLALHRDEVVAARAPK